MLRKAIIFAMLLAIAAMFFGLAIADETAKKEEVKHDYVGHKKCKMCHTKDGIHPSWMETKHAKAWDALSDTEKKDPECVKCHTTGITAEGELLEGVQCEACHGAGADYKKKSIMEDMKAAMAAGLIMPTEETCMTCHGNVPEKFRSKEKFDFEKMKAKGVHAMPEKKEEVKEG